MWNVGNRRGLSALIKEQGTPRPVAIDCFNPRLGLPLRETFKETYIEEVNQTMISMFDFYQNSPTSLGDLYRVRDVMEQGAPGSRWAQHNN